MVYKKNKLFYILSFLIICTCGLYSQQELNKYALVIGISGYPYYPQGSQLKYADADAIKFAKFIQTPSGGQFPNQNVRLIKNDSANRTGITDGMRWLSKRSNSNDLVYIFFSGHGEVADSGQAYFMPYNADPDNPSALGFRTDRFLEDIKTTIRYKQLIFFADACHSGSTYTTGGTIRGGNYNINANFMDTWKDLLKGREEITMAFLAASSNESSWEYDSLQQGVFSHFLIKGLKGFADGASNNEKDNIVTAAELYRYILDNVDEYTGQMGHSQTPMISPTFLPDFPFGLVNNSPKSSEKGYEQAYSFYNQGLVLMKEKNYSSAILKFEKSIEIIPNYGNAYHEIGVCYVHLEQPLRAKEYFLQSIEYDPNNLAAYSNLAGLVSQKKDVESSIKYARKAIEIDPTYYAPYSNLCYIYMEFQPYNFKLALENSTKAYELAPNEVNTINNHMVASLTNGDYGSSIDLALELMDKLKSKYPIQVLSQYQEKLHDNKYYLNSYLYTTLNYLLLDNTTLFEKWYNNLIDLYNGYDYSSTTMSYDGTKNYILNRTNLDLNKKKLAIQLLNLLSNSRDANLVTEYNLSLPMQYGHLKKVQLP